MKRVYEALAGAMVIAIILNFDAIAIFFISGRIPTTDVVISPSMMLAILCASFIMIFAIRLRRKIYTLGGVMYDKLASIGKPRHPQHIAKFPKRRHQEL